MTPIAQTRACGAKTARALRSRIGPSFNFLTTATIALSMAPQVLLPGDELAAEQLPSSGNTSKTLTLGPGLRHIPPSTIVATSAGSLHTDARKNAAWLENNGGRVSQP